MDEIVSTLLEGLLHQKEQLELTIEELNQFEKAYGKDSKITQDRLDKLSVDLDKISQDIETLKAIKPDTIDLSGYATLDDVRQALDKIIIPDMPKVINGIDGKDAEIDYNEIESLVIQWLQSQDLKGKDGITPTEEDIKSIVYEWLEANKDSLKGAKGDTVKAKDGKDGISIDKITYKNNTLYITLTDGTKKEFKMPVQYVGGGGIGENRVREIIAQSGTSPDLQNRAEIEGLYKIAYSTYYSELTYNLGNIEAINIWDTNLKATLLFTKSLTYVNGNITQINITDHLQGVTLTKELSYNNGNIISINKAIT